MQRMQLKHYLEAAGVPEDRYLLVGVDPPRPVRKGAWVLRPNQRSWEVMAWQPAQDHAPLTFLAEHDACEFVFDVLTCERPGRDLSLAASDVPAGALRQPVAALSAGPLADGTGPVIEAIQAIEDVAEGHAVRCAVPALP